MSDSIAPQPLFPRKNDYGTQWIEDWVGRRAGMEDFGENSFVLTGIRIPYCPVRILAPYGLRSPGSFGNTVLLVRWHAY